MPKPMKPTKLLNQYPTPMGVMRHEIAESSDFVRAGKPTKVKGTITTTTDNGKSYWYDMKTGELTEMGETYTIADAKRDGLAFIVGAVGFGILLAIAVFSYLLCQE